MPQESHLKEEKLSGFQGILRTWHSQNLPSYPWLSSLDPYRILVSEVMLQQTTRQSLLKNCRFETWLEYFPDLESLARASQEQVLKLWEGLGYQSRALKLKLCAQSILQRHQGIFPKKLEELLALPGIGNYTSRAVLSFAFDQKTAVVDTNIARLIARLHNFQEIIDSRAGQQQIQFWAEQILPKSEFRAHNQALMNFGQTVCKKKPQCWLCCLREYCLAFQNQQMEKIPLKKAVKNISELLEKCLFICRREMILLYYNRKERKHQFLWKFPAMSLLEKYFEQGLARKIDSQKYSITRYRVCLEIYGFDDINFGENLPLFDQDLHWVARDELEKIPFATPHRRTLRKLLAQESEHRALAKK